MSELTRRYVVMAMAAAAPFDPVDHDAPVGRRNEAHLVSMRPTPGRPAKRNGGAERKTAVRPRPKVKAKARRSAARPSAKSKKRRR